MFEYKYINLHNYYVKCVTCNIANPKIINLMVKHKINLSTNSTLFYVRVELYKFNLYII
jgi:hypothetical protein